MLAHQAPRNIAILSSHTDPILADLILAEVKKHNTVEYVAIFSDVDEILNSESNQTCEFTGSIKRFSASEDMSKQSSIQEFDVIIWNNPLPDYVNFGPHQHGKKNSALFEAPKLILMMTNIDEILTEDGIMVMHVGPTPFTYRHNAALLDLQLKLINTASSSEIFESAEIFEESGFDGQWRPQSYLMVCKSIKYGINWHADGKNLAYLMTKRLGDEQKGLQSIDSNSLGRAEKPHKSWEFITCMLNQDDSDCELYNGFDPYIPNVYREFIEVKQSSIGPHVGRGVFTTVDIEQGSYLMMEIQVHQIKFDVRATATIVKLSEFLEESLKREDVEHDSEMNINSILNYMDGYGYDCDLYGGIANFVDSGIDTFMNHGCNGTTTYVSRSYLHDKKFHKVYNYGEDPTFSEQQADPERPAELDSSSLKARGSVFSPIYSRRIELRSSSSYAVIKSVAAGQELFTNYVWFYDSSDWQLMMNELMSQCTGDIVGIVVQLDGLSA